MDYTAEQLEEFKNRGGIVQIAPPAPKKYNGGRSILDKDSQLVALRMLLDIITDPKKKCEIEEAIEERTELLTQIFR